MSASKKKAASVVREPGDLEGELRYEFRDRSLLELALTHPSVAHAQGVSLKTNQRLEFLGDAVLQLVLSRELYDRFPDVDEGLLTKARAQLVNSRSLAEHARRIGLGDFLIVSHGEEISGGRNRNSALADTFEAVVGAVYLDGGLESVRGFIDRQFGEACGQVGMIPVLDNPKGELQELLQAVSPESPRYQMVSASGPDHDRLFECIVHHAGLQLASGRGKSKKAAESDAAKRALENLRRQRASANPPPTKEDRK